MAPKSPSLSSDGRLYPIFPESANLNVEKWSAQRLRFVVIQACSNCNEWQIAKFCKARSCTSCIYAIKLRWTSLPNPILTNSISKRSCSRSGSQLCLHGNGGNLCNKLLSLERICHIRHQCKTEFSRNFPFFVRN
ncbi:hypothetical protein M758_UG154300 [Ceratodon purpureus]|nr:hypothetical protein M758_UG154300 [Ceratodon purpureus]